MLYITDSSTNALAVLCSTVVDDAHTPDSTVQPGTDNVATDTASGDPSLSEPIETVNSQSTLNTTPLPDSVTVAQVLSAAANATAAADSPSLTVNTPSSVVAGKVNFRSCSTPECNMHQPSMTYEDLETVECGEPGCVIRVHRVCAFYTSKPMDNNSEPVPVRCHKHRDPASPYALLDTLQSENEYSQEQDHEDSALCGQRGTMRVRIHRDMQETYSIEHRNKFVAALTADADDILAKAPSGTFRTPVQAKQADVTVSDTTMTVPVETTTTTPVPESTVNENDAVHTVTDSPPPLQRTDLPVHTRTVAPASPVPFPMKYNVDRVLMQDVNCRILQIAGDGKCLWRAVYVGIYSDIAQSVTVDQFRDAVCDWISEPIRRATFTEILQQNHELHQRSRTFDEYIAMVRSGKLWGGIPELAAISQMYNVTIERYHTSDIISSGKATPVRLDTMCNSPAKNALVRLLFTYTADRPERGHVDLLVDSEKYRQTMTQLETVHETVQPAPGPVDIDVTVIDNAESDGNCAGDDIDDDDNSNNIRSSDSSTAIHGTVTSRESVQHEANDSVVAADTEDDSDLTGISDDDNDNVTTTTAPVTVSNQPVRVSVPVPIHDLTVDTPIHDDDKSIDEQSVMVFGDGGHTASDVVRKTRTVQPKSPAITANQSLTAAVHDDDDNAIVGTVYGPIIADCYQALTHICVDITTGSADESSNNSIRPIRAKVKTGCRVQLNMAQWTKKEKHADRSLFWVVTVGKIISDSSSVSDETRAKHWLIVVLPNSVILGRMRVKLVDALDVTMVTSPSAYDPIARGTDEYTNAFIAQDDYIKQWLTNSEKRLETKQRHQVKEQEKKDRAVAAAAEAAAIALAATTVPLSRRKAADKAAGKIRKSIENINKSSMGSINDVLSSPELAPAKKKTAPRRNNGRKVNAKPVPARAPTPGSPVSDSAGRYDLSPLKMNLPAAASTGAFPAQPDRTASARTMLQPLESVARPVNRQVQPSNTNVGPPAITIASASENVIRQLQEQLRQVQQQHADNLKRQHEESIAQAKANAVNAANAVRRILPVYRKPNQPKKRQAQSRSQPEPVTVTPVTATVIPPDMLQQILNALTSRNNTSIVNHDRPATDTVNELDDDAVMTDVKTSGHSSSTRRGQRDDDDMPSVSARTSAGNTRVRTRSPASASANPKRHKHEIRLEQQQRQQHTAHQHHQVYESDTGMHEYSGPFHTPLLDSAAPHPHTHPRDYRPQPARVHNAGIPTALHHQINQHALLTSMDEIDLADRRARLWKAQATSQLTMSALSYQSQYN